jgi:hypothetical protein
VFDILPLSKIVKKPYKNYTKMTYSNENFALDIEDILIYLTLTKFLFYLNVEEFFITQTKNGILKEDIYLICWVILFRNYS